MKDEQSDPKRRELGYYWVMPIGCKEWAIAFYSLNLNGWYIGPSDEILQDESFIEIDERRIEREPQPEPQKQ